VLLIQKVLLMLLLQLVDQTLKTGRKDECGGMMTKGKERQRRKIFKRAFL
jgi:hypothetical protein